MKVSTQRAHLSLEYDVPRQQAKLPLKTLCQDSDGDGWTDHVETFLGTNPRSADSDKDGRPDPSDPHPTCAPSPKDSPVKAATRHLLGAQHAPTPVFMEIYEDRCVEVDSFAGPTVQAFRALSHPDRPHTVQTPRITFIDRVFPFSPQSDQAQALLRGSELGKDIPAGLPLFAVRTMALSEFTNQQTVLIVAEISDNDYRVVDELIQPIKLPWRSRTMDARTAHTHLWSRYDLFLKCVPLQPDAKDWRRGQAEVDIKVNAQGQVRSVVVRGDGLKAAGAAACLKKELEALRFPRMRADLELTHTLNPIDARDDSP